MAITNYVLKKLMEQHPSGRLITLSRYLAPSYDVCEDLGVVIPGRYKNDLFVSDEVVLKAIGFDTVDVADYSSYDGAAITLDLNGMNVTDENKEEYDFVLDAGTIEHVYNIPNALANVFNLLKVGGKFVFYVPFRHDRGLLAYYGINPALLFDYFVANEWKINGFIPHMYKSATQEVIELQGMDFAELPYIGLDYAGYTWGCVTKAASTTHDRNPLEGDFATQWDKSERVLSRVKCAIHDRSGRVFLYGAGAHSVRLIHMLNNLDVGNIDGIISAMKNEIGRTLIFGIPINSIDCVCSGDTIIISSEVNQKVIYDRIKYVQSKGIKVVTLYEQD